MVAKDAIVFNYLEIGKVFDWRSAKAIRWWIWSWSNYGGSCECLENDFVCKNYILNKLDNTSYYMYSLIKNAKALWKTLDKKYKAEDDTWKKFIVIRFLDFKMVNSRTVMNQVQEFQLILYEIHVEGMSLHESFEVATIIK